jgi:hypothetical protein
MVAMDGWSDTLTLSETATARFDAELEFHGHAHWSLAALALRACG